MTPAFDRDTLALYVLGALDPAEAAPIEAALAAGDAETVAAVAEARRLAASIGAAASEVAPPAGSKDRLLARVRKEGGGAPAASSRATPGGGALPARPRPRWFAPTIVTLLFAVFAGFSLMNVLTERRVDEYVAAVAKIAGDPKAERWILKSTATGAEYGVVYHDRKQGQLIVLGKDLPKPPEGKTYVFWTIPSGGGPTPVNRGVLRPSVLGGSAIILGNAPPPEALNSVAVSLESDPKVVLPTEVKAAAKPGS